MKKVSLITLTAILFVMLMSNASAEITYYYLGPDCTVYTEDGQAYMHNLAMATYTFLLKSIDGNITSVSGVSTYKTISVVCSIGDSLALITFTYRKTEEKLRYVGLEGDEIYKLVKAVIKAYDDTH